MNEEKDAILSRLTKAAGNPRAPKLDETLLTKASQDEVTNSTKVPLVQRFRMVSRRLQLGSLAAASAVGILAVALAVPQQATLRISLAGSTSNGAVANESAQKMVAGGSMANDMMIALPSVEFVASADLENNAGSGDIYQVVPGMTGSSLASAVAKFFGLKGTAKKETTPALDVAISSSSNGWTLTDGSENVYVYGYGVSSFNYYNADAYVNGDCLETEKVVEDTGKDGSVSGNAGASGSSSGSTSTSPVAPDEICVSYAPVEAKLPTKAAAVAEALRIFNHFGYGVTASELYVDAGTDYLNISTYPKVNGISVPFWSNVSWGNTGLIAAVNGVSIDLVKAGTVNTIGAKDSVERTKNWLYQVTAAGPIDAESMQGNPYWVMKPGEEVVKHEITSASATLGLVYDNKGGAWLVPSYKLFGAKGLATTVISVVDGVLDLPSADDQIVPMTR